MLQSHVEAKFYSMRLQNLEKCKTAKELKDKFPKVEDFYKNFFRLKSGNWESNKGFKLQTYGWMTMSLGAQWSTEAPTEKVSLGLSNLRDTVFALCRGGDAAKEFFKTLISKVTLILCLLYADSTI